VLSSAGYVPFPTLMRIVSAHIIPYNVHEYLVFQKSVVAIISLKRKINLATKVKKNGGKVKLYFALERKAAVQSIVPLHSYL
jgi:hypothetical protein